MSETTYKVTIREHSFDNMTARERIAMKDVSNAVQIDEATAEGSLIISPVNYAILDIENSASPDKNYTKYIILDNAGTKYVTGSNSFWKAFIDIFDEMKGEGEYQIEIYKRPSKNYSGKFFLTCSIL